MTAPDEYAVTDYDLRSARAVVNLDRPEDDPAPAEEPHHAAARGRTDEEQAALALPARVGRWVVGKGWVPVDGLGPYGEVTR